jgi:cytochrome c553
VKTSRKLIVLLLGVFILIVASLAFAQAPKPPAKAVLPAANGAVTFDHAAHIKVGKCAECHHASKPQKPSKSQFEKCGDCHTKTGSPVVKTRLQAAFHNPTATAGTCVDCHKKQNAVGKKAPAKCTDCHKKA